MLAYVRRFAPNFVVAWGFALTLAAFVGWLLDKLIPDTVTVSANGLRAGASAMIFVYFGTAIHLLFITPKASFVSPELLVYRQGSEFPDGLFQFGPSEWIAYNALYAIFFIEDDAFERFLCVGRVLVIQDDRKVQLVVDNRAKGTEAIWERLAKGPKDFKSRVIIKPGVPVDA